MNRIVFALIALVMISLVLPAMAADSQKKLNHVVVLKFKEGTSDKDIKTVETAFRDLKKKIPQVKSLEWGTNVSPENLNKGFTHCFALTFASSADRDAYLVHPEHKAFGKTLGPVLADVMVIDFWAQN